MRLQDIMATAVDTVRPGDAAEAAWQKMRIDHVRHLVVMDEGKPVGVVSDRDLGSVRGEQFRRERLVNEVMAEPVVLARPTTTIRQAANLMRGRSIGCLPVVKGRKLVGIVTTTDLLELLGRGAERPSPIGRRPVLKARGPRRKPFRRG